MMIGVRLLKQLNVQTLAKVIPRCDPVRMLSSSDQGTIFDKILDGTIPAQFLHKDDKCVAFKDVAPQAPVHFLVIPRRRIRMIEEAQESDG